MSGDFYTVSILFWVTKLGKSDIKNHIGTSIPICIHYMKLLMKNQWVAYH